MWMRRRFWDEEHRKDPGERMRREFMLFHVLDRFERGWEEKLLELGLVSRRLIESVRRGGRSRRR